MMRALRGLSRGGLMNPLGRVAVATWAWGYRHEILRWGRSLWNELIGRGDLDPGRAARTGRVLMAIATEDRLRNAPELRQVTINGDVVDLEVTPGWSELPHVVDKVRRIKGVAGVTVNGAELTTVTATSSGR